MTGPVDEAAQELLRARARELARPRDAARRDDGEAFLVLTLTGDRFALPAHTVRGVFRLTELVPVPGARAPLLGVAPWRGDLLTVADPASLLAIPREEGLEDRAWIVVLGGRRHAEPLGLLVHAASTERWPRDSFADQEASDSVRDAPTIRAVRPDGLRLLEPDAVRTAVDPDHRDYE